MIVTLLHRVALGQDALHDGVAALVDGDDPLLRVGDDAALALRAGDDPLQGLVELRHADDLAVAPRGQDGGLVHEVGQVGAGEAGRLAGQVLRVDGLVERLALGVDLQDGHAAAQVRPVEDDLAVEAAGPQQGRVQDVRPVGGGDDDHVGVRVEAVHLDQDLVEGLLALVVGAAQAGAALAADRVDLVHEDDAGRVALGLVEEVADAAGADADEHLDELGAGDREEGHAGLAGHGSGEQRLAGARRADEQHAARDARARGELNFSGYLRNSTTSWRSVLASSTPATSAKVTTVLLPRNMRARLLPKLMAWLLVPCAWRMKKKISRTTSRPAAAW